MEPKVTAIDSTLERNAGQPDQDIILHLDAADVPVN